MRHITPAILVLSLMLCLPSGCSSDEEASISTQLHQLTLQDVQTGLPKIVLTTPGNTDITSKDYWMEGVRMTIYNTDGSISFQGTTQAKGRGNSTWGFPKKPYALRLDKKSEILGMPRHKRWCLLANWVDRTLMRNAVGFEIARQMPALAYTPRGTFVELFINGAFQGNYYLCEQIKIDENRVNITEPDDASPNPTGGYIFEVDEHFDEDYRFASKGDLPWQFKVPDEVTPEQFAYGRNYVDNLEDALFDETRFARRDFAQLMNLESFADWWLVMELACNVDPQAPRSCYMYKDVDVDGKVSELYAGPVWDFDYNSFIPELSNQYTIAHSLYYPQLLKDATFRQIVKQRWADLKVAGLAEHICQYIDQTEALLTASDHLNACMWTIGNAINADTYLSYHDAVARLKLSFIRKYTWLDYAISEL